MLKSNNKFTSAIKSIAIVLALVAVLVMSLAGCTDEEARQMATDAANKANAAVTQAQLNDAVSAALADYAKKTDVMTQDGVASVVTDALKDYAKTADVLTMAQVETAIKTALADRYTKTEVDALISGLRTELQNLVHEQATDLQDQLEELANNTINKDKWDAATGTADDILKFDADKIAKGDYSDINTVVEACAVVDIFMAEIKLNESLYTKDDYNLAIALCEAAKVRYIRSYEINPDEVKDLFDDINGIPTIYTAALVVADLIADIPVPMTTSWADQKALILAEKAFDKWCNEYTGATAEVFNSKIGDATLLPKMEFARTKLVDTLAVKAADVNNEIKDYLKLIGFETPVFDVVADVNNNDLVKAVDAYLTECFDKNGAADNANEIVLGEFEYDLSATINNGKELGEVQKMADAAAVLGDNAIVKIGHADTLAKIFELRNAFIGDMDNEEDGDNNGSADDRIPYWTVIEACFETLNDARYNVLKTSLVANINGEMKDIVNALETRDDNGVNDILRNAVATLEHDVVSCINGLAYSSKNYAGADYQKRFEAAKAHLDYISGKITKTDTNVSVLQTLVDDYDALIKAEKTYAEANATLAGAIEDAMKVVNGYFTYPAN